MFVFLELIGAAVVIALVVVGIREVIKREVKKEKDRNEN